MEWKMLRSILLLHIILNRILKMKKNKRSLNKMTCNNKFIKTPLNKSGIIIAANLSEINLKI